MLVATVLAMVLHQIKASCKEFSSTKTAMYLYCGIVAGGFCMNLDANARAWVPPPVKASLFFRWQFRWSALPPRLGPYALNRLHSA